MSYIIAIQLAARNSRTVKWLANQRAELLAIIREYYALYCGLDQPDELQDFTSNHALSWIYDQFGPEIEEYGRLTNHPKLVTYPAANQLTNDKDRGLTGEPIL